MEQVTSVVEEYLETIYRLQKKSGVAKTSALVKSLKVVPGTITNTIERLEKEGYVTHKPYKGVKLTEKGRKIALTVLRKHRLSERLLVDILHLDWDKVHEAACKLEHGITNEIIKPLEKTLRHPKTCPHGNPIPTKCGVIIEEESQPLTKLNKKEKYKIVKITEEKSDILHHLSSIGIVPGALIEIIEKGSFNEPLTIEVAKRRHIISWETSSIIQVKQVK
jgi:DtxR family Mn-dependent transcriptional regulator